MPSKIVLIGEGGQGVQVIAKILAKASRKSDKISSYLPSFGVEQRGGVSLAFLQISSKPILYPKFLKANICVVFSNRSVEAARDYLTDGTLFIYDSSAIEDKFLEKVKHEVKNYLAIPALKIAQDKFTGKVLNVVILGAISAYLKDINYQDIESSIIKEFEAKIKVKPEIKDLNLGALKAGLDYAQKFDQGKSEFKGKEPAQIERTFPFRHANDEVSWTRFPEYCKGCGLCIVKCPVKALQFTKDVGFLGNPLPIVDIEKCIACGSCEKICPDGAIKVNRK